jgi:MFS family permease
VVAAYLQVVRGYDAIQTGVIFTAATVGLLASSLAAERLATRRRQRTLIMAGFLVTIAGIGLLLAMVVGNPSVWAFTPGLLLIGLGLGLMLTHRHARARLRPGHACAVPPTRLPLDHPVRMRTTQAGVSILVRAGPA